MARNACASLEIISGETSEGQEALAGEDAGASVVSSGQSAKTPALRSSATRE